MLFEGECFLTGIIRYFTSIIATAILGMIASSLITDPRIGRIIKTVSGVLILLVLLRPLLHANLEALSENLWDLWEEQQLSEDYEAIYMDKLAEQVKSTTENYILSKAASIGAEVQVSVELTHAPYPIPYSVEIVGKVTEEQREFLSDYLTHQLNIDPHNQRWNIHD